MNNFEDIEILAPCGSFASLQAAINSGADSVYFGASKLNMRAASSVNFSINDLKEIISKAKEKNIKTYLTLNTIMYDEDLSEAEEIILKAKEDGIDAIIASDFSIIELCNKYNVRTHISTQANISNIGAVRFFAKYADVIVLARELTLDQVANIINKINQEKIIGPNGELIKIEIFVHGALCMAVSGKCYLSLHEWNKSANRGQCLQTCRRSYIVTDKESGYELEIDNEYIMSPKDLRTIHFLDKILATGAKILKIEGRGRSPEYVKYTVECYKEAVESVKNNTYSLEKIKRWEDKLSRVYNRGFWDGYYLGQKLGEWSNVHGSQALEKKVYIGDVTNYFSNIKVAEVLIRTNDIKINDKIMIIGDTTGVYESTIIELRNNDGKIDIGHKGEYVSFPVNQKVRRNDKVYKILSN